MAAPERNHGFTMLEEFVCPAVLAPDVQPGNPARPGRSEGLAELIDVVFDARAAPPALADDALHSEVARLSKGLSAYLTSAPDPVATLAAARRLLLAELDAIEKAVAGR